MLHLLYHKNTEKKIKDTKAPTKKPFVFVMNKLVFPLRTTDWFRSVCNSDWWNVSHASLIPATTVGTYHLLDRTGQNICINTKM